ncbi:hypothetical protein ACO34A_26570 (plasmid) [Rhizobium sp. ACO-34A]|nr:DUF930 domain-containing protein [Rhizobium sp. ACO-34A]ATN37333.1 hypothetical protein ACO34A_26570 [Rhizobium sp. ACO-34A]
MVGLFTLTIAIDGISSAALALSDERLNQQLLKLDPETRLEQTCDTEVMFRINHDANKFEVDKVIAYAFGDSTSSGNSFNAPGAVFRSRGQWYHLKYMCQTGPRHLDAHKLTYEIGPVVPRSEWSEHYLYD